MEKILQPLKKFSDFFNSLELMKDFYPLVKVNCYAVGGSVRDTIIGTPVKDIDIALCFDFLHDFQEYPSDDKKQISIETMKAQFLELKEKKVLEILMNNKYSFMHEKLKENLSAMTGLSLVLQHCLQCSENYEVKKAFDNYKKNPEIIHNNASELFKEPPTLRENAYFNMGLSAVIMIQDKTSEYPVELLLTASNVEEFVDDFDFNLCKAYLEVDGSVHTTEGFEFDKKEKILTYTPNFYITEKKIERSLIFRLGRFAEKFPLYKLGLDESKIENHALLEKVRENVKALNCYHQLNRMKNISFNEVKKKPMKI